MNDSPEVNVIASVVRGKLRTLLDETNNKISWEGAVVAYDSNGDKRKVRITLEVEND